MTRHTSQLSGLQDKEIRDIRVLGSYLVMLLKNEIATSSTFQCVRSD